MNQILTYSFVFCGEENKKKTSLSPTIFEIVFRWTVSLIVLLIYLIRLAYHTYTTGNKYGILFHKFFVNLDTFMNNFSLSCLIV